MLQQIAADKDRSVEEASASTLVGDGLPLRRMEDPRPWETSSSRIEAWHPLQHLAVKLAHYASGLDNACSADPSGGIKHAIECRRPNREVTWVNIIASRCEFPA